MIPALFNIKLIKKLITCIFTVEQIFKGAWLPPRIVDLPLAIHTCIQNAGLQLARTNFPLLHYVREYKDYTHHCYSIYGRAICAVIKQVII